jgi:multiple sugar transport system permease protein
MSKNKIGHSVGLVFLWFLVILCIIPFLSMFSTSMTRQTFELPYPPQILPDKFYFGNYVRVWTGNNFASYLRNSVFLSAAITFFVLLFSSLSAYGFARFNFPGKELLFNIYLFTMMVPSVLNLIAQFAVLNQLNLIDTYTGIVLISIGGGVAGNTFFLRGFFSEIPREFDESIVMDGGGRWTIFRHIILPLSKPALGTLGIMIFTGAWGDYFTITTFIKNSDMWTLPVGLQMLKGEHGTEWGLVFAGAVITFIPELIIFIIAQKYFVQSNANEGAIKG